MGGPAERKGTLVLKYSNFVEHIKAYDHIARASQDLGGSPYRGGILLGS